MKKYLRMISPFNNESEMPKALYVIKKVLAFIFIYIISSLLAEAIAIAAHFAIGLNPINGEMLSLQSMLLMKYYGFFIFSILTMLYCKFVEKRTIKSMGFNRNIIGFLKGILLATALLGLSLGFIVLTGNITYNGISNNINITIIIAFLGAFIIQGAMEETMCRGFLMVSLSKKVTITTSILISSILFALPHFSSLFKNSLVYGIIGIINLLLVSAIFSLLMIKNKNIWVSCAIHSFWNFFLFNIVGLNLSGTDKLPAVFSFTLNENNIINGGSYGIESSIITTLVLAAFMILLIFLIKRKRVKDIEF